MGLIVVLSACGGQDAQRPDETAPEPPPPDGGCSAGEMEQSDGSCLPAGMRPGGCAAGEWLDEMGSCAAAGVPSCAAGFTWQDGTCSAILPADCPPGQIAIIGTEICQPLADCGSGTWGNIPLDATSEHVDASYSGGNSDGSAARPWTTIGDAVTAAAGGDIVAIAEGDYVEDIVVLKPITLWGRCPDLVSISGVTELSTLLFDTMDAALHGVTVRGAETGVAILDRSDVFIDSVWFDGNGDGALIALGIDARPNVQLNRVLISDASQFAVFIWGSDASLSDVMIKDSAPSLVEDDDELLERADVTMSRVVVQRSAGMGIELRGSSLEVSESVLRDTAPADFRGWGIAAFPGYIPTERSAVLVRDSVVERTVSVGCSATAADASYDRVTFRDILPNQSGSGAAVAASREVEGPSTVVINQSTAVGASEGVIIFGANLTFDRSLVRDGADSSDTAAGIVVLDDFEGGRGNAVIRDSVVERVANFGVIAYDSSLDLAGTRVSDVFAGADNRFGRGVDVASLDLGADLIARHNIIERCHEIGIEVFNAGALMEGLLIREALSRPDDGLFGDGIAITSSVDGLLTTLGTSVIDSVQRAGLVSFGGMVNVTDTHLMCNQIHLSSEPFQGRDAIIGNLGGNVCGCGDELVECALRSSSLAPPEPPPTF